MTAAVTTPESETEDVVFDIANVPATGRDNSNMEDRSRFEKGFEALLDSAKRFDPAWNVVTDESKTGGLAMMEIRESILNRHGHPDFAGNSTLYTETINAYLNDYATRAGLNRERLNEFRSRCSSYLSDHQIPQSRMALYLAKTKELKDDAGEPITTKVVQKMIDDANAPLAKGEKREPIKPQKELKAAMIKEEKFQSGKDGKTRLNGFKVDQRLTQFGRRPAKPRKPATTPRDPEQMTHNLAFELVQRESGAGSKLSRKVIGEQAFKTVSAAIRNGLVAKAAPSDPPENREGLNDLREYIAKIGTACDAFVASFDDNSNVGSAEVLALLWKEDATS